MTTLQQLASGQNNAEVPTNENFETLSAAGIFGKKHSTTSGLTWGYYGGVYNGNTVSDGTVTLTDDAVNVLVVERATGIVSTTDGSDALAADTDYAGLYEVTTASGVVTAVVDLRMDDNGLLLGGAGGGGSGTVTNTGGSLTANAVMLGAGTVDSKTMASLGTSGQVLTSAGAGTPPTWATPSGGGSKTYAVFTPMTSQPPASNYATLDTRNSIAVLDFDGGSTDESALWVGVIPEGASLGSGIEARIHWMATSATSNDVKWGVQFEKMTTDLDSDSFDSVTTNTGTANGTSGIKTLTSITCTTIDSLAAGDLFRLKVTRVASDTTNDNMAGDAELIAVELRSV